MSHFSRKEDREAEAIILKRIALRDEKIKRFDLYYPELVAHPYISEEQKEINLKALLIFKDLN